MAYAEKRGKLWRARWYGPDGALESRSGFATRRDAERHGRDQEAAIRSGTYTEPRAGQVTLTEWVNRWYPGLDLELNTLSTYRYLIEVHILPTFASRPLATLTREEIALWEKEIQAKGYRRKTAHDARSLLATMLSDATPRHLQQNPAIHRRGTGRKGQGRIERAARAEKAWATPLQVLLFAERCSQLSRDSTDFVMAITMAYTGMRWSEALGLQRASVHDDLLDIDWKLYELGARFYRGRPKDGSIRSADLPPFLAELLRSHLADLGDRCCICRNPGPPWCGGDRYLFLRPGGGHFRRSNYSTRIVRPAADGWYPGRKGPQPRAAAPVLVDMSAPWPGALKSPWPAARLGEPYEPPTGRGIPVLAGKDGWGRCGVCGRTIRLRLDGVLGSHKVNSLRCVGTGAAPAQAMALASWLPVCTALTPHGLRHGHQTWLDDLGIRYVLQSERMGHEVPGMRGVYSHITTGMRTELAMGLQQLWEESLSQRARLAPTSSVAVLDELLMSHHQRVAEANADKIGSHFAPRIGHERREPPGPDWEAEP